MNKRISSGRGVLPWIMAALAAAVLAIGAWGCARRNDTERSGDAPGNAAMGSLARDEDDGRLCVVTTIFPYYDFARQIAGDRVKLKLVVPAGMDSHSFEPTPADMIAMQEADVLVCNGGEMEQWVEQVLDSLDTGHMKVLTMMDHVDVVEEEHVEGMEESAHRHGEEEDGHEMHIEYDEHIWTSPVNAQAIVKIISGVLSQAAPEDRDYFEANTQAYIKELQKLDSQFKQVVDEGRLHTILVADKFPFRYFADQYGLSYRAAFSGCSGDTEPSARTIAYLIDKVKEDRIPAVYYLELSSPRTAQIISEETGAAPLLLHSCHNVTRRQFDEGVTYLQLMRQNVENLRRGLQ